MLEEKRQDIVRRYGSYQRCIWSSFQKKNIDANEFRNYLKSLEAFESGHDVQCKLLTEIKSELEEAETTHDLLSLVNDNCASYMNIRLLEHIVEEYHLDDGQEQMKYPQYLLDYINLHSIKDIKFAEIDPELVKSAEKSKTISLKLDIETTCKLAKISDLHVAVARILHLVPSAVQIYSIEEGCVVVKFCLPTRVADIIFTRSKKFSIIEQEKFISLSVLWLQYEDMKFYFSKDVEGKAKAKVTTSGKLCMY